jgi:hypothetical protein
MAAMALHQVQVDQVQLDELLVLLKVAKAGEVSDTEAIHRLSRSPHGVWVAMDPESKWLASAVGECTLAMAQRVHHRVVQVFAPDCAQLFLTDGFQAYRTAWLAHDGYWVHLPRRRAQGPAPKPRGRPLPHVRYALYH